jgi:hypothetical protein
MRTPLLVGAALSLGLLGAACGSDSSTLSSAATVMRAVGSECFRVALATASQVAAARAAQAGGRADACGGGATSAWPLMRDHTGSCP